MINILIGGNNYASKGLLVIALSIAKHVKNPVHLYVLTMDLRNLNPKYAPIDESNINYIRSILQKANKDSEITSVDCTDIFNKEFKDSPNNKNSYTPYAALRLLADLIPEIPDKILYIDTDTLIAKDIQELYDLDIEDYEFAACLDYYGKFWINHNYQNSGVLLLNMKKIKETGLFVKCRKFYATKWSILSDQDALNKYVLKKYFLPRKYNEQFRKPPEDTVIKHFSKQIYYLPILHTVNVKPWMVEKVHTKYNLTCYDDVLNEYLQCEKNLK